MIRKLLIIMCWLVAGAIVPVQATHIVGGEMTYECLGSVGASGYTRYRITLKIYQDCLSGQTDIIEDDDPAVFAVFDGNNNIVLTGGQRYSLVASSDDIGVPPNFRNECVNSPPRTCLRRMTFIREYILQDNTSGYHIVYQRCCRSGAIMNIASPLTTGATYSCFIPPQAADLCNNSAVFKNYPPQIICINNPLVYDHSAIDPDADSLSYGFCEAYVGASSDFPKPGYAPGYGDISPPPYPPVSYIGGFSALRPMVGNPPVQIDPVTGVISGTPNLLGHFVVTVCCYEWRNGVIISTVTREFQFVVTDCSKAVVADIPQLSTEFNTYIVECDGYTVQFRNRSSGGFSYYWDFGAGGDPSASSTAFEPSFTYPDTGVYTVKLVVNRGSTCPDSISRLVKIYPYFNADFETEGLPCPKGIIQFNDLSKATYNPVTEWAWSFGDGHTSVEQFPAHAYDKGGDYTVSLASRTVKGCVDTIKKVVSIDRFHPFAGNDTIIVKGSSMRFNASGGAEYRWSPATHLDYIDVHNPTGYYPDTTRLDYVVYVRSENNCEGYDTINVWVVGQASAFVPSAFTPNGDGLNDILIPIGIGYNDVSFFRVYNRYGQEVYFSSSFKIGWDGTYKGQPAESGTYYWVLKITDRFGKEELLKGDVTLVR